MIKKIILFVGLFIVLASIAIGIFARKAPVYLQSALENAIKKKVVVKEIRYFFPADFELYGFSILEQAPFEGEPAFAVDRIRLSVSPLSVSQHRLIIDEIEVENAAVYVHKTNDKLLHALSAATQSSSAPAVAAKEAGAQSSAKTIPLEIRRFRLKDSEFYFIDYDILDSGYAFKLDEIEADIRNIRLPLSAEKTSYEASARLVQGRDRRAAEFRLNGWSAFLSQDTNASIRVEGLFIPFFEPYYKQVTPATIEDGQLNAMATVIIENRLFTVNSDLEVYSLLFQTYEGDNQLFGLNADQILSFLKDRSGKLNFQITADWNMADRSVRTKDIIRRSIENSLKRTIFGNVGRILENTLKKLGESKDGEGKEKIQKTVNQIKDFLKFD